MEGQKQHLVNWKDGMKIGVPHLVALENSLLQQSHQLALCHVHAYNYGIIAQSEEDLLQLDTENNLLYLNAGIQAITPEGAYIDIAPTILDVHAELPEMHGVFHVFLQLHPFKRGNTLGMANIAEHPIRAPFVLPQYSLQIVGGRTHLEEKAHRLLIGRMQQIRGEWTLDKRFMPACRSLHSCTSMRLKFQHFVELMQKVQEYWQHILRTLHQQINDSNHPILQKIRAIGEQSVPLTSKYQNPLQQKWMAQQPPIFLLQETIQLANTLQSFTDCLTEANSQKLWKYWRDMSGNQDVRALIGSLNTLDYHHSDTAPALEKALTFLEVLTGMLGHLSRKRMIGEGLIVVQVEQQELGWVQRFVNWMKEGDVLAKVVIVVAIMVLLIVVFTMVMNLLN